MPSHAVFPLVESCYLVLFELCPTLDNLITYPHTRSNMRTTILLVFAVLTTAISAYSDVGTYERLFYWYAYTLDTSGTKIAPGCAKSVSPENPVPCTFTQFMNYIDKHKPPYKVKGKPETLKPSELEDIDPNNVEQTVRFIVFLSQRGL